MSKNPPDHHQSSELSKYQSVVSFRLSMDLFHGETLAEYLKRSGELSVGEAARILVALTDTLLQAHQHGVVHVDVRPDNVMLVPDDGGHRAIIVGWGTGKVAAYLAPEQLQGLRSDGRADIYTAGVVAYEMLTGARPPRHAAPIVLTRPDVPAMLDALVLSMLANDPAKRPWLASARLQLAALTEDDADDLEISASPSFRWE